MRIVITGGATGIGAATAAKLSTKGSEITIIDIIEPIACFDHWIEADLSDPDSIDTALQQVDGHFDTLINCAELPPREGLALSLIHI